jgi:hypothetical protein
MRKLVIIVAAAAGLLVAACSSSPSTTTASAKTGTEVLHGQSTGAAAAANLNSNSNAPLTFQVFTYAGPVVLTVHNFKLPGNGGQSSGTGTLPGGLRVHHVSTQPHSNGPPPATWVLKSGTCSFTATFDRGTYTVVKGSTGKFTGATGHGTYQIIAKGNAPLAKGKTTCTFTATGKVSNTGAAITFSAHGPLKVPA